MTAYIIRRILQSVFTILIITLGIFFLMRLMPGDPLKLYYAGILNLDTMEPAKLAELRHEFGLDKPLLSQYISWVTGIFQGDMGTSIYYREDIGRLMLEWYPVTLYLGVLSLIVTSVLGILIGLIAALRRDTWLDSLTTILAYFGQAMPIFWLGILLIYILGLKLRWLPISGYTSPFNDFWQSIRQVIMPVICLSLGAMASIARQMRSSLIEIIHQDYIRTAWSKGLREKDVVLRHTLKNSLIPVVTMIGMFVPVMFGGVIFVETVFAIPGIGLLLVNSIFQHDYQVVQSITLVIAVIVVMTNLLVDLIYGWIDPRIQYN